MPLTLDDGAWHTATGLIDFDAQRVSLSVDGNAIFDRQVVPGLAPFENRIILAAQTGGEFSLHDIDNLSVVPVPEPSTVLLGLLGLGTLLYWRTKKS